MIMAPWLTHLSITFLFSGSDGVSFGPPGISTCVIDSCHYITLLLSLLFSPGRYRQSAHGTRRRDDHCGSEQALCQQGSHLASTLSPGRYFCNMFLWTVKNPSPFVLDTFVSHPPLDGKVWWMNFALSPVSPRQARTWESNLPILSLPIYCSPELGTRNRDRMGWLWSPSDYRKTTCCGAARVLPCVEAPPSYWT